MSSGGIGLFCGGKVSSCEEVIDSLKVLTGTSPLASKLLNLSSGA